MVDQDFSFFFVDDKRQVDDLIQPARVYLYRQRSSLGPFASNATETEAPNEEIPSTLSGTLSIGSNGSQAFITLLTWPRMTSPFSTGHV